MTREKLRGKYMTFSNSRFLGKKSEMTQIHYISNELIKCKFPNDATAEGVILTKQT